MSSGQWTSLEVVKLVVAAATPVVVAGVGFWLNRRLKSVEQAQWSQQKVIERRITAYDTLAVPLNELFCFFCYVGGWKELTPPEAVRLKRRIDQAVHVNAPLFEKKFLDLYNELMGVLFSTFGRWGSDATLKTLPDRREEAAGEDWDPAWTECFAPRDQATEPDDVKRPYGRFMAYLAEAIGVQKVDEHLLGSTQTPGNFDARAAGIVSTRSFSANAEIRPGSKISATAPDGESSTRNQQWS